MGPGIDYTPTKRDLTTLARGLRMLGEILFAGGAQRVMVNSWGYEEFTNRGQLEWIDQIALEPGYLALGTGHPQGGNAMSRDPRKGVVGPDFRVHGYENLYIADASVIPSSLTREPAAHRHGARAPRGAADEGRLVNGDYDITPLRVLAALGVYALIVAVYWFVLRDCEFRPRLERFELPHGARHRARVGGVGVHRQLPALPGRRDELPALGQRTSCTPSSGSGSA